MNEKRKIESLLSTDGNFIITLKKITDVKAVCVCNVYCMYVCDSSFQCFRLKEIPFSLSTLEVCTVVLK